MIDQFPVRATPLLEEVVFFHRASRTVILADLSEAFDEAFLARHWAPWQRWIAQRWGITEHRAKAPLELRLTAIHRRRARAMLQRLVDRDPRAVIMAHGVWRATNGRGFLLDAFDWLDLEPRTAR
ncbi:hypothetical protein [Halomonas nitroreducens]|uniref:hypothetical protein n=1 Tax=Halomonas nitroreducens TaxID=447425 RepID=UPI001FE37CD0|nr:hypothetical protein [Halomonas nitroreducens]